MEMTKDFIHAMNTARASKSIGNFAEALEFYKKAVAIEPSSFQALIELGILFWESEKIDEALRVVNSPIIRESNNPTAFLLKGHIFMNLQNYRSSIDCYLAAINTDNNNANYYNSLALAYKENNQFKEAMRAYDAAISIDPNNAEVHKNRGILLLLSGNLTLGFEEYEWRKSKHGQNVYRDYIQPEWRGEELDGKTLLVHHEQGMGDAIQFSRYIQILKNMGIDVFYAAHPPLIRLLSTMGDIAFVNANDQTLIFDYHCPLLSLPLRLGTIVETIPANIPYLTAEPERVEKWRKRIGDHGFRIGVAWQGSAGRFAKNRLFPASYLKPLQDMPGVRLIGLHKVPLHTPWQLPEGLSIEPLGPDFDADYDAFLDTAAVIESCDLVICCDTAVAHLAGAMGKPTWLIVRHMPHWVWMMDRADSPWYPSVRLFRQKRAGDWGGVFADIYAELPIYI